MTTPQASNELRGQTVVFRADASLSIGSGHVMRGLTLADALKEQDAECVFLCREHEGHLCGLIEARGFQVHRLPIIEQDDQAERDPLAHAPWLGAGWEQDAQACLPILADLLPAWLVVDHYALDRRWETAVVAALTSRPRLLVIDDLADRPHIPDLLLDQNLGRHSDDYRELVPESCPMLIGPRYALLRSEFAQWRDASLARRADNPGLKRLLISLGGVDKDNVTGQILDSLRDCELPSDLEITIVMGGAAPWLSDVKARAAALPRPTSVVVDVNDMAKRMAEADLAIGAAGSTAWERCCLGLPTLVIVLAENQRLIAEALEAAGAARILGASEPLSALSVQWTALTQPRSLACLSRKAAAITAGSGVADVCRMMREMTEESL